MKYLYLIIFILTSVLGYSQQIIDLSNLQDANRVLENPHKGWFHHLWDEHSDRYPVSKDSDAVNFPGLQEMFIRIPWAELEPSDNNYNWTIIDDAINRWEPKGFDFSFQIICSSPYNLEYEYASPQWLKNLGVNFTRYDLGSGYVHQEPDYANATFRSKLREFHQAFVNRYASQSYFAHVEVGSYGDFGEGHTSFSSSQAFSLSVVKDLIDIYDLYPAGTVHCSEDYCTSNGRSASDAANLRNHIEGKGFSWRDNSVLVDYWLDNLPANQYSIAEPEYFQDTYGTRPTFIEIEHYFLLKENNNWQGSNGATKGAAELRGAMSIVHPSYMGFHGDIAEWYGDNPQLAGQLANEIGYWYFINEATLPSTLEAGEVMSFSLQWQNRGVAPAYNQYALKVKLDGATDKVFTINNSKNRDWWNGETETENYSVTLPANLSSGDYTFKVKLVDLNDTGRQVDLGFKNSIKDSNGFFSIGTLSIVDTSTGSNVSNNPGFEANGGWSQNISNWSTWSSNQSSNDADYVEPGGHSGSYQGAHWKNSSYAVYTYQTVSIPNGSYTLKAWVRGSGGQKAAQLEVKDYGGAKRKVNIGTASSWKQISITDIAVTNGSATYGFWSDASANHWINFDDVEFFKQPSTSEIIVRARGTQGGEALQLRIKDTTVKTFTLTTSQANYTYSGYSGGNIKVYFADNFGDVNVDYIKVDGQTYQAEDRQNNTGVWQNGSCGGSYSSWLHCAGFIGFGSPSARLIDTEESELVAADKLVVYPNPTDGRVYFTPMERKEFSRLTVYDNQGRVIFKKELNEESHFVDLDGIPGYYQLVFEGSSGKSVRRVINKL